MTVISIFWYRILFSSEYLHIDFKRGKSALKLPGLYRTSDIITIIDNQTVVTLKQKPDLPTRKKGE